MSRSRCCPDSFASDPDRLARFTREAQTLASLNHPNIAHIHGLEESDGVRALVMELVEGDDLSQRIARGAIPIDEALPIAKQIAEALEAAHEQGIIHRDLKPANIKVRPDGTVKVLDFGLAKAMEPMGAMSPSVSQSPTITSPAMMTGVGVILGTAAYMAPEQAKGREADKRSDIWAFGCVLYEMLTGRRPFDGDDVSDTLANVLKIDPDWLVLPSEIPPAIRTLLQSCLTKDRRRRVADISTALFVLEKGASLAPPVGTVSVAPLPRRPLWRRIAAVTGVVLVVAAVAGAAVWFGDAPRAASCLASAGRALGYRRADHQRSSIATWRSRLTAHASSTSATTGRSSSSARSTRWSRWPYSRAPSGAGRLARRPVGRVRRRRHVEEGGHYRGAGCHVGARSTAHRAAPPGRPMGQSSSRPAIPGPVCSASQLQAARRGADAAGSRAGGSRSPVAGDAARRSRGAVHDHCSVGRPRRRASGRSGPADGNAEGARARRQSRAVRAERPSRLRRGGHAAGGRVRPGPPGDPRNARACRLRGGDDARMVEWTPSWRATARSPTCRALVASADRNARWCGSVGRGRKPRSLHRPAPTSILGSPPTVPALRSGATIRTATSGAGILRAPR